MNWQFYPWYHLPSLLGTILALAVAAIAWRKRAWPGALPAVFASLALALCTGASIFEIAAPDVATKLFWVKVEYPGVAAVPTLWFLLILHYLGYRTFLTRRNIALLFAIPLLAVLLNWTNSAHHWFYARTWLDSTRSIPALGQTFGVWGWISISYGYLLSMCAAAFSLHAIVTAPKLYQKQTFILFGSACLPLIASLVYLLRLGPIPCLDLTPLAFISSCGLVVFGIYRFRLWEIIPVAHQLVIEQMGDGILVCDGRKRVVEINPAACRMLSLRPDEVLGFPCEQVLPDWLCQPLFAGESALFTPEDGPVYEVKTSRLAHHQDEGQLIVLRDVTSELSVFEERERGKIARYLHDEIGQTLSGALMHLSIARRLHGEDQTLETVETLLSAALRQARALTTGTSLQPGLQGISALVESFGTLYGLAIALEGEDHLLHLSKHQNVMVGRILRELLFNIIKHADSPRAWIRIRLEEQRLLVRVEDEGVGIQGKEGYGLTSIRGQLGLIGGTMKISARPGAGTCVELEIPAR